MPLGIGIGISPVFVKGGGTYGSKVLSYNPFAYWIMGEASGTDSICQVDTNQNGTYSNVTLGQPGIGDGNTCPDFNGTNSVNNIYSATLNTNYDPTLGSIVIWGKVEAAAWTDGLIRTLAYVSADAQNYVNVFKSSVNGRLEVRYRANSVTEIVQINGLNTTDWFLLGMTWNVAGDRVRCYYNGAQSGGDQSGLGVWVGALAAAGCSIGAAPGPSSLWDGPIAHCSLYDTELDSDAFADLYSV